MRICNVLKRTIKSALLKAIELIEKIEYRNYHLDENDISKKIVNTIDVSDSDILCNTDSGYKRITHIHLTQPYTIWNIRTEKCFLECADNHIVFDNNMKEIFIKDLKIGDEIITKYGAEKILSIQKTSTKVSMFDTTIDSDTHRFYTNDILSHNTVTSSIFLTWFVCFHFDKNIMIVANKGATVKEIIDKVKVVYENLPFFLKPGIITNNVGSMKFDNGSRFIGQNTSKTPGLGFTIHLLYADEFAHIQPNIINDFYRSIFPTMSSSKMSRMIITSTANGMNKFYEIYSKAVKGENDFHPMKIDWDAVPGRDEAWKQAEIANLGSEEEFKQEYENQFFSDSQMALDRYTMKKLMKYSDNYIWTDIAELEDEGIRYNNLIWDKSYASFYFSPFDRFVLSVDISSGTGKDYSVITIFKVEPKSLAKIRTMRRYDDEGDFFRLRQIGVFRDNKTSIDDLAKIIEVLTFDFFGAENTKIVLEMNHKGELIVNKMEQNPLYYPEIFIHTKHSAAAANLSLGIKLNKGNKPLYCSEMGHLMRESKLVITEKNSVQEALNFGIDKKGNYKSQLGNDDIIMTCVNITTFFKSLDYYEIIEDIIDTIDSDKRDAMYNKLETSTRVEFDIDYSMLSDM